MLLDVGMATFEQKDEFFNGLSNGQQVWHGPDARHWQSGAYALVGKLRNGLQIIGEQDAVLLRGPGQ
jgi:hypothetical protein